MSLNPEEFEILITKRMHDVQAFMGGHAEQVHRTALELTNNSTRNARVLINSAVLEIVAGYSDADFRRDFYDGTSAMEDRQIARLVIGEMETLAPNLFKNSRPGPDKWSR